MGQFIKNCQIHFRALIEDEAHEIGTSTSTKTLNHYKTCFRQNTGCRHGISMHCIKSENL